MSDSQNEKSGKENSVRFDKVFNEKKSLKAIYEYMYRLIEVELGDVNLRGQTVEFGSGTGITKKYIKNLITTDIFEAPYIDRVCDATNMNFENESIQNIIGIDFLHHLNNPEKFLNEVQRVLKPGGKCILIEPWMTPISYSIYKLFHEERTQLRGVDPWNGELTLGKSNPMDGNQAIPYLVFEKYWDKNKIKNIKLIKLKKILGLSFPASGGIKHNEVLPFGIWKKVFHFETKYFDLIAPFIAFRALIVLQKTNQS